jgi:hypothetical protein
MAVTHEQTAVSGELQGVLDHVAGPMPPGRLECTLDPALGDQFVRGTWFRSTFFLQDRFGAWHMVYPLVEHAAAAPASAPA